ncbi:MAG: hypothetical protein ABDH31_04750 [Chlorobiota bacterium]
MAIHSQAFAVVFCVLLLSCATPRAGITPLSESELSAVLEQLHTRQRPTAPVVTLSAELLLPRTPLPVRCQIEVAGSDSLWAELWGPFGVAVGQLRLTASEMQYYDALRNVVLRGKPTPQAVERALGLALPPSVLFTLLRPEASLPERLGSVAWEKDRQRLKLCDTASSCWTFRSLDLRLLSYETELPAGQLQVEYSGQHHSLPSYPERLRIAMAGVSLALVIRDVAYHPTPSRPYSLNVPTNAARVELE